MKLQTVLPDECSAKKESHTYNKERKFRSTNDQSFYKKSEGRIALTTTEDKGKRAAAAEATPRPPKPTFYKETLEERKNKKYSFRKDAVRTLFDLMSKNGLHLPEIRRPSEVEQTEHPLYCPYHRHLGHTIEDCWNFKDLVEDNYQKKQIHIARRYLLPEASVHMVQHIEETTLALHEVVHGHTGCEHKKELALARRDKPLHGHTGYEDPVLARHEEVPHGQTGWKHVGEIASIYMVHHSRETPSERENHDLAQQVKEKDEQIAHLKFHLNGMVESMNKLAAQVRELQNSSPSMSKKKITPRAVRGKGKVVATTDDVPELIKPSCRKETLEERRSRKYSFSREAAKPLFHMMIEKGLQLPEPKRPCQMNDVNNPEYCPYHRRLGHAIEDCWTFKDVLEDKHQKKIIQIPGEYLLPQPVIMPQKLKPKSKNYRLDWGIPEGLHLGSSESSGDEQIIYEPPKGGGGQDSKFLKHTPVYNSSEDGNNAASEVHNIHKTDIQKQNG